MEDAPRGGYCQWDTEVKVGAAGYRKSGLGIVLFRRESRFVMHSGS